MWSALALLGVPQSALAGSKRRIKCPKVSRLVRSKAYQRCVRRSDGVLHGPSRRRFRLSADVGSYVDGEKQGRWRVELFTGEVHELDYDAGQLHGLVQRRDTKGVVRDRWAYQHGAPHGGHVGKWPDGTRRVEERFVRGASDGVATSWHEDGSVARVAHYKARRLHGPYEEYWHGGKPLEVGHYIGGLRDGVWRGFHATGSPLYVGDWRAGVQAGIWRFFDAKGDVVSSWGSAEPTSVQDSVSPAAHPALP